MLVDLGNNGYEVYYVAPIFHEQTVFNAAFQGNIVVGQSAFFRPSDVGYLADDEYHCIAFNDVLPHGYFRSEPRQVRAQGHEAIERGGNGLRVAVLHPDTQSRLVFAFIDAGSWSAHFNSLFWGCARP
jgi:hypothetical protein